MTIFRNDKSKFTISYSESNVCSSLVPKKREKTFFPKMSQATGLWMSDAMQVLWHLGEQNLSPLKVCTDMTPQEKKKCQATVRMQ